MMDSVRITHFSDALCVWAYVSQIRCDELVARFPDQVSLDCRYFQVFGNVANKIRTAWSERGGVDGYAAHVRAVAEDFPHISVHPEVWVRNAPESSMPAHLVLCAVRLLVESGDADAGASRETSWMLREAFFRECADIGARSVLLEIVERAGLPIAKIEAQLDNGRAHAALAEDLEMVREQSVNASPTLVFNDGRQRLAGNVGYRIIEANVRELLESPTAQSSWC